MENIKLLIEHTLALFSDCIDISDGKLRADNGFFSQNLTDARNSAEDRNGATDNDVAYMIWSIYRLLHRKSRENYSKCIYTVTLSELSIVSIEKEYIKVINELSIDC